MGLDVDIEAVNLHLEKSAGMGTAFRTSRSNISQAHLKINKERKEGRKGSLTQRPALGSK
jgi:hypothetical protein